MFISFQDDHARACPKSSPHARPIITRQYSAIAILQGNKYFLTPTERIVRSLQPLPRYGKSEEANANPFPWANNRNQSPGFHSDRLRQQNLFISRKPPIRTSNTNCLAPRLKPPSARLETPSKTNNPRQIRSISRDLPLRLKLYKL